ncbi:MAG: phycobilisome protein [Cyanobacteria bacterium J06639_1]
MLGNALGVRVVTNSFSAAAKAALARAGIVKADEWQGTYPEATVTCVRNADTDKRFLTDAELDEIAAQSASQSETLASVRGLRDRADDIVTEARTNVLSQFPGITEPGGDLYPAARAEACWRDFWHFLRCTSYGIAGQNLQFVSAEGTHHMNILYRELNVPLAAMRQGVAELKTASMKRLEGDRATLVAPYFDRLIERLSDFTA